MDISLTEFIPWALMILMLIVYNLILKSWDPPIKSQYKALLMIFFGMCCGWYCIDSTVVGMIVGALIYYKHELLDEINATKQLIGTAKEQNSIIIGAKLKK